MKNIIIIMLIFVSCNNSVWAQKVLADKVPISVKSAFKAKFPSATKISWSLEKTNDYEAEFRLNGLPMSANFDSTGLWLETETDIKVSDLSPAIQSSLKKDFAGYKINEASKIESLKDPVCYEVEIEKKGKTFDILYSPNGIVLSKTEIEKG